MKVYLDIFFIYFNIPIKRNITFKLIDTRISYAVFEYAQEPMKQYMKVILILKSEALKERHWKQIFKALYIFFRGMTVGNI